MYMLCAKDYAHEFTSGEGGLRKKECLPGRSPHRAHRDHGPAGGRTLDTHAGCPLGLRETRSRASGRHLRSPGSFWSKLPDLSDPTLGVEMGAQPPVLIGPAAARSSSTPGRRSRF